VAVALEPPENGLHRAARQVGVVHDVEAVADGAADGAEHGDGGDREWFPERM
jgi:hypothetical protein